MKSVYTIPSVVSKLLLVGFFGTNLCSDNNRLERILTQTEMLAYAKEENIYKPFIVENKLGHFITLEILNKDKFRLNDSTEIISSFSKNDAIAKEVIEQYTEKLEEEFKKALSTQEYVNVQVPQYVNVGNNIFNMTPAPANKNISSNSSGRKNQEKVFYFKSNEYPLYIHMKYAAGNVESPVILKLMVPNRVHNKNNVPVKGISLEYKDQKLNADYITDEKTKK